MFVFAIVLKLEVKEHLNNLDKVDRGTVKDEILVTSIEHGLEVYVDDGTGGLIWVYFKIVAKKVLRDSASDL